MVDRTRMRRFRLALGSTLVAGAMLIACPVLASPILANPVPASSILTNQALTNSALANPASDTSAKSAQAAASKARAKVDALLERYAAAETQVDAGIAALSASFAAGASAETSDDEAAAQQRRAHARQNAQVRALYAAGGPVTLTASVLGATSPEDALWRASTMNRALAGLFTDTASQVSVDTHLAILSHRRATQAAVATQAQAQALQVLQRRAATAQTALDQAQKTLAGLDVQARQAQAAVDSARQIAAAQAAAQAARRTAMGPVTALGIPAEFELAYRQAATTCPGMRWTLLAGVGQVESGHGRTNGPSSAGAIGPMQFMPATFKAYAVDGDHDGVLSAWDPQDAIFTAAHYLCTSAARSGGAGSAAGVHAALLAYNHAEWYVDLVLAAEQAIIARQTALSAP
jgi:hypothetical protein